MTSQRRPTRWSAYPACPLSSGPCRRTAARPSRTPCGPRAPPSMQSLGALTALEAEAPPPPDLAGTTDGVWDAPGPPMPYTQAIAVLDTIPGVDQRGAELLVAEWGTDMRRFGTASRLSAWAGVAPGNDEGA